MATAPAPAIDGRRINFPLPVIACIILAIVPILSTTTISLFRVSAVEMELLDHDSDIQTLDQRLHAHDLQLNTHSNDMRHIKIQLDKITDILEKMQRNH